jgi:hypothetical protein
MTDPWQARQCVAAASFSVAVWVATLVVTGPEPTMIMVPFAKRGSAPSFQEPCSAHRERSVAHHQPADGPGADRGFER